MTAKERITNFLGSLFKSTPYSDSFAEYLSDRISSPFFLSFIAAWIVHNYKLFFGFVFFDSSEGCQTRYEFLKWMLGEKNSCDLIWYPLVWSFVAVLCFYSFDLLSKGIRLLIKRRAEPSFFNLISKGIDTLTKEEAQGLYDKCRELEVSRSEVIQKLTKAGDDNVEAKRKLEDLEIKHAKLVGESHSWIEGNEKYVKLQEEFNAIQNQLGKSKANTRILNSLAEVFFGEWVNEFQFPIDKVNTQITRGKETFVIREKDFIINKEIVFTVSDIVLNTELDVLTFKKTRVKRPSELYYAKLIKVSDAYWVGLEIIQQGGMLSLVRFYPKSNFPNTVLYVENDKSGMNTLNNMQILWRQ